MSIKDLLGKRIILFDGAMGTMLQKNGLNRGELPEMFNMTKPDIIERIHTEYIQAGSDVITTNTFGANGLKLKGCEYSVDAVITQAVKIAKKAAGNNKYVALDIGPTGKITEPFGDLSFNEAYDLFKEQVVSGTKAGADLIILETFTDLYEMKAGILAAKENSHLPVFCSVTFEEDKKTLMGTDPLTMVNLIQDMGIDALGINCSLGPDKMAGVIEEILQYSRIPVLIQPNAGLPKIVDGQTVFDIDIEHYVHGMSKIIDLGVKIIGGCCGTTPEYIKRLKDLIKDTVPKQIQAMPMTAASSSTKTVILDDRIHIIGERINPANKKILEALQNQDMNFIIDEAINQAEAGAHILDVNAGYSEADERETLLEAIKSIETVVDLPILINSSNPDAIEKAVRYYNGKPIIGPVNGKKSVMDAVFPIAKKYGTCVIALTIDEKGLPQSCEERVDIADKIIRYAQEYGIGKEKIIIDCMTVPVFTHQESYIETLQALKIIKESYGVKTTLNISNISHGLPEKTILNKTYLVAALTYGLDAPITDPTDMELMEMIKAFETLNKTVI